MTGRDNRADDMRAKGAADLMRGSGGSDKMQGGTGGGDVFAQDGPDALSGGLGADTLGGGKGSYYLAGGEGSDALDGGGDDDTYRFRINDWGNDSMPDTTSADNDPDTGSFAGFGSPNQFLSTSLTIDLTSSAGSPEVSNVALTSTVNWSNNAIVGVYVGGITDDDTINGNDSANTIVSNVGPDGDDTINAKAGHDWISILDFAGVDTVDFGGQADDQVFYDQGDTVKNCP